MTIRHEKNCVMNNDASRQFLAYLTAQIPLFLCLQIHFTRWRCSFTHHARCGGIEHPVTVSIGHHERWMRTYLAVETGW